MTTTIMHFEGFELDVICYNYEEGDFDVRAFNELGEEVIPTSQMFVAAQRHLDRLNHQTLHDYFRFDEGNEYDNAN